MTLSRRVLIVIQNILASACLPVRTSPAHTPRGWRRFYSMVGGRPQPPPLVLFWEEMGWRCHRAVAQRQFSALAAAAANRRPCGGTTVSIISTVRPIRDVSTRRLDPGRANNTLHRQQQKKRRQKSSNKGTSPAQSISNHHFLPGITWPICFLFWELGALVSRFPVNSLEP